MSTADSPAHQELTNAFENLQRVFGKPPSPSFGAGGLRLKFDNVDLGARELSDILTDAGAKIEVRVKTPVQGGMEDMLIGTIEGKAFMANGVASTAGPYSVDIRVYTSDSKKAMVGADALFAMLDALLQAHPVPPDALPGYLAYRLQKDKPKDARKLAAEMSSVLTDFLTR